jgi:sRNA-binding regulator protein Hfq
VASTIAAYFDLEIKQFDIINVFINTERDSNRPIVIYKLPDGFKVPGYIIEVDRALYRL